MCLNRNLVVVAVLLLNFAAVVHCSEPEPFEESFRSDELHELIWLPVKHEKGANVFLRPGIMIDESGSILFCSPTPSTIVPWSFGESDIYAAVSKSAFYLIGNGYATKLPDAMKALLLPGGHIGCQPFVPSRFFSPVSNALNRQYDWSHRQSWEILDRCNNPVSFTYNPSDPSTRFYSTTWVKNLHVVHDEYTGYRKFLHADGTTSDPFNFSLTNIKLTKQHGLIPAIPLADSRRRVYYDSRTNQFLDFGGTIHLSSSEFLVVLLPDKRFIVTDKAQSFSLPIPEGMIPAHMTDSHFVLCRDKTTDRTSPPNIALKISKYGIALSDISALRLEYFSSNTHWVISRSTKDLLEILCSDLTPSFAIHSPGSAHHITPEGKVIVLETTEDETIYKLFESNGILLREFVVEDILLSKQGPQNADK